MLVESGVVGGGAELDTARLEEIMDLLKERIALTTEIPDSVGYFYGGTLDYDEAEFEKQFGKEFVRENFPELVERLVALPGWTEAAIEEAVRGLAAEKEKGARHLIHPLRFAVTGPHRQRGPLRDHAASGAGSQPAQGGGRRREDGAPAGLDRRHQNPFDEAAGVG